MRTNETGVLQSWNLADYIAEHLERHLYPTCR
jgi:hypothetical protein